LAPGRLGAPSGVPGIPNALEGARRHPWGHLPSMLQGALGRPRGAPGRHALHQGIQICTGGPDLCKSVQAHIQELMGAKYSVCVCDAATYRIHISAAGGPLPQATKTMLARFEHAVLPLSPVRPCWPRKTMLVCICMRRRHRQINCRFDGVSAGIISRCAFHTFTHTLALC
jgi:hypothetical protein